MATLKNLKIQSSLKKKGFDEDVKRKHKFYYFIYEGKETIVSTSTSHGDKEIGDPLIKDMYEQLFLDKKQFFQFVECPLTKEKYIEILKEKGII